MITIEQMRALVRVGMKYGNGWALYSIIEVPYSDGVVLQLELRTHEAIDYTMKVINIYKNGEIRIQ